MQALHQNNVTGWLVRFFGGFVVYNAFKMFFEETGAWVWEGVIVCLGGLNPSTAPCRLVWSAHFSTFAYAGDEILWYTIEVFIYCTVLIY